MRDTTGHTPLDVAIARLAGRQHGVIALRQLVQFGLKKSAVTNRVASGRLHRIHRGVYSVGHRVLTREGRWAAAVLACGRGAVLSHRSAAELWNVRRRSARSTIDVATPHRGSLKRVG